MSMAVKEDFMAAKLIPFGTDRASGGKTGSSSPSGCLKMRKNEENQLRPKGQPTVQKTRKQLLGAQVTPSLGVSVKKRKFGPKLGQANSRR
jgi:hypothetical protein